MIETMLESQAAICRPGVLSLSSADGGSGLFKTLPLKDGPKLGDHPRTEGSVLTHPSSGACVGPSVTW